MRTQPKDAPRVGIFWFYKGKLIIDSTPLSAAEQYGEFLGHPASHIDHWANLQRTGVVPPEVEYEEAPRGRVVYHRRLETFTLLADKCILDRKNVVRRIIS